MQPDLFTPHQNENNPGSQQHLNENRSHFSDQCRRVYGILFTGNVLTVSIAMNTYQIMSLPRRILDLKRLGFKITDRWSTEHKTKTKEYFMTGDDINFNKTHYHETNNTNNNPHTKADSFNESG